jgi:hypothetical protein
MASLKPDQKSIVTRDCRGAVSLRLRGGGGIVRGGGLSISLIIAGT